MSRNVNEIVVDAYRKHLRRAPDPEGFTFWVNAATSLLKEGKTHSEVESTLANEFTNSPEYKNLTTS